MRAVHLMRGEKGSKGAEQAALQRSRKIEIGTTLILVATAFLVGPHVGVNYIKYWFDTILIDPLTKIGCVSEILLPFVAIVLLALLFFAFVRMFTKLPKTDSKFFVPAFIAFPLLGPIALPLLAFAPLESKTRVSIK